MKQRHASLPPLLTASTTVKQLVPYMEASHLPLRAIARQSGVPVETLYRWFNGKGSPRAIDLEAVATVVNARIVVEPLE